MRFYRACIHVAESVGALLTKEQEALFIETDFKQLFQYQISLGMWIRHHHLPHNAYLRDALTLLGMNTPDEMSLFLIEFAQQYLKLKYAEMV